MPAVAPFVAAAATGGGGACGASSFPDKVVGTRFGDTCRTWLVGTGHGDRGGCWVGGKVSTVCTMRFQCCGEVEPCGGVCRGPA
eukprot:gene30230-48928_t